MNDAEQIHHHTDLIPALPLLSADIVLFSPLEVAESVQSELVYRAILGWDCLSNVSSCDDDDDDDDAWPNV